MYLNKFIFISYNFSRSRALVQAKILQGPIFCYTHTYEFIHWHSEFLTQLPFELKLTMPPSDIGGRGYSDAYTEHVVAEPAL